MRDPASAHPLFGPERDAVQAGWLAAPASPAAAFAEADELLAGWTAAVAARTAGRDTRPAWARRYWQKRNTRARLPGQAALRAGAGAELRSSARPAVTADGPALLLASYGPQNPAGNAAIRSARAPRQYERRTAQHAGGGDREAHAEDEGRHAGGSQ